MDAESIVYKVIIQGSSNIKSSVDFAGEGRSVKLTTTLKNHFVTSFKINGVLVNGDTFFMPAEEAIITDVVFKGQVTIESEHNPYSNNLDEYKEYTFEGATSLNIELDYQTQSVDTDWIYLYDSAGNEYGKYGGTPRKTEIITVPRDYVKIFFHTDYFYGGYYGYKAIITANYD